MNRIISFPNLVPSSLLVSLFFSSCFHTPPLIIQLKGWGFGNVAGVSVLNLSPIKCSKVLDQ